MRFWILFLFLVLATLARAQLQNKRPAAAVKGLLTRHEAIEVLEREVSMTATQPAWCPLVDFGAGAGFEGLLPSGTTVQPVFLNSLPYGGSIVTASDSYAFLVDDEPGAQWAHAVRFVVIDATQSFSSATAVESSQGWWMQVDLPGSSVEFFNERVSDVAAGPTNPDGLVRGIAASNPPPSPAAPLLPPTPFSGDPCAILFTGDNTNTFNDDVDRFEQQMMDRGMPMGRIKKKKGGKLQDLKDLVTAICGEMNPPCDKIFVYVGSHGSENSLGFQGATKEEREVTEAELVDALCPLARKGAKLCILIQACHSGSLVDGVGGKLKGASIFTSSSAALTSYGTTYYDKPSTDPTRMCLGRFSVFSNGFSNCWDDDAADKNTPKNGVDWEEAWAWVCAKDPTVYDGADCPDTPKERSPQHPMPQYTGSIWVNSWTCAPGENLTIHVHGKVNPADKPVTYCVSNGRTGLKANTPVGGTDNTDVDGIDPNPKPVVVGPGGEFWDSFTVTCKPDAVAGQVAIYKVVLKVEGHTVDVDYGCVSIVAPAPGSGTLPSRIVPEPASSQVVPGGSTQSRYVLLNENPFPVQYDVQLNAFNHFDAAVGNLTAVAGISVIGGEGTPTLLGQTGPVLPFVPYELIVDVAPSVDFDVLSGLTIDLAAFDVAEPIAINGSATVTAISGTSESLLLVGSGDEDGLLPSGDVLLVRPLRVLPMDGGEPPVLGIPAEAAFSGARFYVQVYMSDPVAFPDDPVKLSNGLEATIGSTLLPVSYGPSSGILLEALEGTPLGGQLRVRYFLDE